MKDGISGSREMIMVNWETDPILIGPAPFRFWIAVEALFPMLLQFQPVPFTRYF